MLSNLLLKAELIIRLFSFTHEDIVIAQYRLESGHGNSRIAKEYNNVFGMGCVVKRPTTSIGCKRGFAVYPSVWHSIADRKILDIYSEWDKLGRHGYIKAMKKIYCKNCKKYLDSMI